MSSQHRPAPGARADSLQAATLIGRNASFRFGGQVVSALINVAGMVLLGNYLGSSGYGTYTFYYALIPLLASLSDLGVGAITTREIARHREDAARLLGDALTVKLSISSILLLVGASLAWLFLRPSHAALVTIVLGTALVDLSQDPSVWLFRAHERQELEAALLLVSQVTWVGGIALCVLLHASILAFLASAALAFVIRYLVGWWIASRMICRPSFHLDWARLRHLARNGLPFGLAMFGVVLYGRIGVLLLQTFSSSSQVALFNVAYMLSQPLGFISSALSMAAFPALSRYAQQGPQAIRSALLRTSKYQVVITMPLMAGLFLMSDKLIPILFHRAGFSDASVALKIMSLGLLFIFMNLMSRYLLTAMDRQAVYMRAIAVGLAVNVALGSMLIPWKGFIGACIAQMTGEFSIFCVCQASLSRFVGISDLARLAWRPFLAAALMGAVVLALRAWTPLVVVPIGAATYFASLVAVKGVSPEEWRVLRGVYVSFRLPGSARWTQAPEKT